MTRFKTTGIISILLLFSFIIAFASESRANGKIPPGIAYPPSLAGHGSMKKYEFFGDPTMTLKYKLPPKTDDLVEMAYQFFELNKDIFHMKDPRTELKFEGAGGKRFKGKDLGSKVTFWQVYKGIGGLSRISLLFTPEGDIKYMQGAFYYDITMPTTPKLDKVQAEEIALNHLKDAEFKKLLNTDRYFTHLLIWKHDNGDFFLVWRVYIRLERPVHVWEYYIDALNGEILYMQDLVRRDKVLPKKESKQIEGDLKLPIGEEGNQSNFQRVPSVDTLKISPKSILRNQSGTDSSKPIFLNSESSDVLYWETITTEDYEGVFPSANWYTYDNDGTTNGEYYWDDVSYTSHGGFYSAWCAAGGANGLDPATSNYANNMKSWMVFGPFSLCDSDTSILTFWHSTVTEVNKDFLSVKASIDGQIFYGWDGSGNTQGWIPDYLDLNNIPTLGNLNGHDTVWIAFIFKSDGTTTYKGTFIDDVLLQKNTVCPPGYAVGTGYGVLPGDYKNHIDSYRRCCLYELIDITRQENNNPHGHDGKLPDTASIRTYLWNGGYPGVIATDFDNVWSGGGSTASAVDAHVYAGWVYDYINWVYDRNSFDSSGSSMISTVDDFSDTNNAYFDPGIRQIVYNVAAYGLLSTAGALDVAAHEWGHAVTRYSKSKLAYIRESGALNEAFSDMLGVTIGQNYNDPGWRIGENIFPGESDEIRDMSNPPADSQPDTYGEGYWIDPSLSNCLFPDPYLNDYCWVHTNSGVPNKMFYLLANGGSHNGVTVNGIGIDNAMWIMYLANTKYWDDSTIDLKHAATGTILAAREIDGEFSSWQKEVSKAWAAVKVCTIMSGDPTQSNSVTLGDVLHLVNYVFDKDRSPCLGSDPGNCWTPNPFCRGNVSGDQNISMGDVIWLVNYLFDKDNLPCVGADPGTCWMPIPSDICCKLP